MVETPSLLLFPYLPLSREVILGRWKLLPVRDFTGPWRSAAFQRRSGAVIRRHVDRGRPAAAQAVDRRRPGDRPGGSQNAGVSRMWGSRRRG
jgi:hypothetical protein